MVKFKQDYTVQFMESDNIQSGEFIFKKGKAYNSYTLNNKLYVTDLNGVVNVYLSHTDIKKYLGESYSFGDKLFYMGKIRKPCVFVRETDNGECLVIFENGNKVAKVPNKKLRKM